MPDLIELVDMPMWLLIVIAAIGLGSQVIKGLTSILEPVWRFIAKNVFKIQTKHDKKKEMEEIILLNQEAIKSLTKAQEQDRHFSKLADNEMRNDLNNTNKKLDKISDLVLNMRIENMRKTLLAFASDVASGKPFTKEQYDAMFKFHSDYEILLEENDMTNGQVDISMEIVKDTYKKYMISGDGFIENQIPELKEKINKNDFSNLYDLQKAGDK